MGTTVRTFALLHLVCTRISGKVQTKKIAIAGRILILEIYVQRYVQIRIVLCTSYRERRACLQGQVSRLFVSVKPAVVQTCWISRRLSARFWNRLHPKVFGGAKLGANGCKGANDRPGQPRRSHPLAPGGRGRALPRLRSPAGVVDAAGRGLYPCYDYFVSAKRPSRARPLPGVLGHSEENL